MCVSQILAGIFILAAARVRAEVKVTVDYHDKDQASSSFTFKTVPPPSRNDAATSPLSPWWMAKLIPTAVESKN